MHDASAQSRCVGPVKRAADVPSKDIKFGTTPEGYYQYNWNQTPDRSLALRGYDTRGNTSHLAGPLSWTLRRTRPDAATGCG